MILAIEPRSRAAAALVAALILCPYVTLGLFSSDLSPFYLLFVAGFTFLFVPEGAPRAMILGAVLLALTMLELAVGNFSTAMLKLLATIFIAEMLILFGLNFRRLTSHKALFFIMLAWALSGVATLVSPKIFSALFFRVGYTEGRGATGLCPEPSVFGLCSAFLYGVLEEVRKSASLKGGDSKLNLAALVLAIFSTALSMSAYGLGILGLLFLHYRLKLSLILGSVFIVQGVSFLSEFLPQARLVALFQLVKSGGLSGLLADTSIGYRFANFQIVYDSLFGNSGTEPKALLSGFTILFAWHGLLTPILLAFLIRYTLSLKVFFSRNRNIVLLPALLMMLFVGPLSIPFLWLWLGVWESRRREDGLVS